MQEKEHITNVHGQALAVQAGMGDKNAHKSLKKMTRQLERGEHKNKVKTGASGPGASIPLLEKVPDV